MELDPGQRSLEAQPLCVIEFHRRRKVRGGERGVEIWRRNWIEGFLPAVADPSHGILKIVERLAAASPSSSLDSWGAHLDTTTRNLLPRPARNERGEGQGRGAFNKAAPALSSRGGGEPLSHCRSALVMEETFVSLVLLVL